MRSPGRSLALSALAILGFAAAVRGGIELVLPGGGFFPGWRKSARSQTFIKTDLFNHIDGGAELFLEFGFERASVQRYAKDKAEIVLEAYEMASPDAAFGIYLMKCGDETPLPGIPARNSSEAAQFTILKGNYFVLINNPAGDKGLVPAMTALAAAVLAPIPTPAPEPRLWEPLPQEKRIAGSERLIRGPIGLQPFYTFGEGNILGLGGKIFCVLANYDEGGGQASTRLSIAYPTAAVARNIFIGLRANLDPYLKVLDTRETVFSFVDFRERYGLVRLTGTKIEIAVHLPVRPKL